MKTRYRVNGREVSAAELSAGSGDRLREMLESGQAPSAVTDATFLAGHANGSQFEGSPHIGDYYAQEARRQGVDPKGKVYLSGLASYPGDPRAWVESRGDVQRVCEERGWGCRGSVNVKAQDTPPVEPVAVAEDILEAAVQQEVVSDPGLLEKPKAEVREKVKNKIKPHWTKG